MSYLVMFQVLEISVYWKPSCHLRAFKMSLEVMCVSGEATDLLVLDFGWGREEYQNVTGWSKERRWTLGESKRQTAEARLKWQLGMKIAIALIDGISRISGWFLLCLKWLAVTHVMAEQNRVLKCHSSTRIKMCLHWIAEYAGKAPLRLQSPFSLLR